MEKKNSIMQFLTQGKNHFALRVVLVILGVIAQGIGVWWLTNVRFGTDPCTVMNLGISAKLGWTYGNTLLAFNCILIIVVLIWGRKRIGIGTVANMVIVGYAADLTGWIMTKILPVDFFSSMKVRIGILIPALIWFIFAAALYMAVDLGQSPYDAIPVMISEKLPKVPFMVVRICWDGSMALVGFLLGSTVGVVTVAVALFLGPVISFLKSMLQKKLGL